MENNIRDMWIRHKSEIKLLRDRRGNMAQNEVKERLGMA